MNSCTLSSLIALGHDLLVVLGIYLLLGRTISLTVVAALLTVIGYSMNDKVVVFDRIRENVHLGLCKNYVDTVNLSINQTLNRTILTSLTTFIVVFGNSVPSLIFAIGFLYIPQIARIVRANVMSEYNQDYVRAVVVSGARAPWILWKHVVRNCVAPVLVFTIVLVADAIVFEASLSFISAGIPEPTPTWGNILADARNGVLAGRWWQALFPGLMIMITVLRGHHRRDRRPEGRR